MPRDDLYEEYWALLVAAAERIGIPIRDAHLLRLHSNALFALPSAGLVIRIATNPAAVPRVTAAVGVTRWLAAGGFPCVIPADIGEQPLIVDGRAVSVWGYIPPSAGLPPSAADLGRLLHRLHDQPALPQPPPALSDPFDSVAAAIDQAPEALSRQDHEWLTERIGHLGELWQKMDFPHLPGLIHGDAHPGNLLRTPAGEVILCDWDHVAIGPREWDLAQIYYTQRRFGRPPEPDIESFTEAYGWNPRRWPGLASMIAIREITGLSPYIRTAAAKPFSGRELASRLSSLRRGDITARWNTPPNE
jgi:hypothetical protein